MNLLNSDQAAVEAGTDARTARQFAAESGLPRVGSAYVWTDDDVDDLAEWLGDSDDETDDETDCDEDELDDETDCDEDE